ncbi:MAG: ABC transporter ATP-binding protein [Coriobacteriales bacterium]|jgi:ABC-type thiamine transport system ATPase subunit|nr:ABC transporter ATP-binding protein [Coriobacteriales bacterium]
MNLRYENLCYRERTQDTHRIVLKLGHGQIEHARITALNSSATHTACALFDIIAGTAKPTEGRLTYGLLGSDGRWRYHPEVPAGRMKIVRQKKGLHLFRSKKDGQQGAEQLDLLRTALLHPPELLLVDALSPMTDDLLVLRIDELLMAARDDYGLTVILICNDPARIARLGADSLTLADGDK